jgi:spermidine synthase
LKSRSTSLLSAILPIFFLSGAAGGIYEVIWVKELVLIFGGTAFAVSTVLSSYMAGLAIGSYLFGRYIDKAKRDPVVLFAALELGIGLCGALILVILPVLNRAYYSIYTDLSPHLYLKNTIRFLFCFFMLVVPTTLMGGTLPVLSKGLIRKEGTFGLYIGRLYAVNTLGAMFGALCVGFFLLPAVGVIRSTLTAFALNCVVAIVAILVYRHSSKNMYVMEGLESGVAKRKRESKKEALPGMTVPGSLLLVVAAISGFTSMSYQVVYTRLLKVVFSNTVYAFTTILVAFLAGIGLGSLIVSRYADRIKNGAFVIGVIQVILGIAAIWTIPLLFNSLAILNGLYDLLQGLGWGGYILTRFGVSLMILLGAASISGATFPLVMKFRKLGMKCLGKRIGDVYAVNTIAAVLGSFSAGFILIPALGTYWGLVAIVCLNLCAGIICLLHSNKRMRYGIVGSGILLAILSIVANPKIVFVGKHKHADERITVEYLNEGANATVYLLQNVDTQSRRLYTDGIGAIDTNYESIETVVLLGHIPTILSKNPRNVLVIGFGMGKTTASIAKHPVERIDCVEIVPEVLEAAHFFKNLNDDILSDPRLNIVIDDGRSFLFGIDRTYDVISCDPIHPAFGSPALYTKEYYVECRRKLNEGGVIAQYLPFHQLSPYDFNILLRTFNSVFPHTTVWISSYHGILVGSKGPYVVDTDELERRIDQSAVREDLIENRIYGVEGFFSRLILGEDQVRSLISTGDEINTDDHPILEYAESRFFGSNTWIENMEDLIANAHGLPHRTLFGQAMDSLSAFGLEDLFAARIHAVTARLYFEKGMQMQTIDEFIKQLMITPGDPQTLFFAGDALSAYFIQKGRGFLERGDGKAALGVLEEAVQLGVETGDIYATKGILHVHEGDTLRGIDSFRKALVLDPMNESAGKALETLKGKP